jgi:perosamine synthetase
VGAGAELAAWSFHPRKLLTTGEGGMLTTDREDWAARARRLREHGMSVSAADRHRSHQMVLEEYLETGFNYRMTDLQAAVGLVQLSRLDAMIARRRELAAQYRHLLAGLPGLVTVRDPSYGTTNYQSFWIVLPEDHRIGRDALLQQLADQGISARRGIMAAHLEPAYADAAGTADLSVTEWLTRNSLILPLFHQLTEADQRQIAYAIMAAV